MLKYNVIVVMCGKNILNFLKKDLHSNFFCIIFALANKENRSLDHLTIHRGVEQLAARRAHNPEVGGSSPPPATKEDKSQDLSSFFSPIIVTV